MKNEETQAMAEVLGQPLGEILVVFIAVVNALREQPGFDDARFVKSIQALLSREGLSEMQRAALSSLLNNSE
jgi:hypothetical protein